MADNTNITEVESDDALTAATAEGRVLVDFYATWCGPCKRVIPELEKAASELEGENIAVVKADIEKVGNTVAALGIQGVPLFAVFQDGKVLRQRGGVLSAQNLVNLAKP